MPFFFVVVVVVERDISVCGVLGIGGRTEGNVLPRGQSGVPSTVWKEKRRRGKNRTFISLLFFWGRELFLELFLSGIIRGADFFDFL